MREGLRNPGNVWEGFPGNCAEGRVTFCTGITFTIMETPEGFVKKYLNCAT